MAEVMGQLYWQASRSLEKVVGGHACPASRDIAWRQEELGMQGLLHKEAVEARHARFLS
jgi:hypothetical protein